MILITTIGLMLGICIQIIGDILISEQHILNIKKTLLSFLKQWWYQIENTKVLTLIPFTSCLITLILYSQYSLTINFFKYLFFMFMMILIGYIDFKTTYVYRITTLATCMGGLVFIILESLKSQIFPFDNLLGALIGFIVITLIVIVTQGMGEGDIEISTLCGLFLGIKGSILTLFLGIIFGGIGGAILLIKQSKGLKDEMAFGPYLVLGAMTSMLCGQQIFDVYLSLF